MPEIIKFVKQEDFDILHFQEVSAGEMTGAPNQYRNSKNNDHNEYTNMISGTDCFEEIKQQLGYNGLQVPVFAFEDDPKSLQSVATLYKPDFVLSSSREIWMKPFTYIPRKFHDWETVGRAALLCKFVKDGISFTTISTHMAWGEHPHDEPYKIDQAKILYNELSSITDPFVLTGDFNVVPESQTASMFDIISKNLTKENHITNTLNPNTHTVKTLFPNGLAVDFVFVSPEIKVNNFKLVDSPNLSDHYGLSLEFEI